MIWRDIVARWLLDKNVTREEGWGTLDVVKLFVEKSIVPVTLMDNPTLHTVILTQIMWETLKGITVPPAPQGNNFTYRMNAKEMLNWDLAKKSGEQVKSLEKETGVNLDYYYKLNIGN